MPTEQILALLQQIKQPGSFCTAGTLPSCFPGLEVTGIGPIALPLLDTQAQAIIQQCAQAPFGRGEATVVDTDVRRVWELEPAQFQLTNPLWNQQLVRTIAHIQQQLGLGKSSVHHELYKLLIYEPGSFFAPHRDTEKLDNMFATLVVTLPAWHEGGHLQVSHEGETQICAFDGENSRYSIQYAAFYADCKHEIKPLQQGYRLSLIYNLALSDRAQQPSAPQYGTTRQALADVLKNWVKQSEPQKMALLLDHKYSQAGLSMQNLKNLDWAYADVLMKAAETADCKAYLALLTLWESGSAEGGYDYDWHHSDDDYEMEEIFDSSLSADHWLDANDVDQAFGEIKFFPNEIISETEIEDRDPDEQEVEGPTGNAGATMDRWYRRAVLVVWPQAQHFFIQAQAGPVYTLPKLENQVQSWLKSGQSQDSDSWRACYEFANEIIYQWPSFALLPTAYSATQDDTDTLVKHLFVCLLDLNEIELIRQFMQTILLAEFTGDEGDILVRACQQHGWSTFQSELLAMVEAANKLPRLTAFAHILQALTGHKASLDDDRRSLCQVLSQALVASVLAWHPAPIPGHSGIYTYIKPQEKIADKIALISDLIKVLSSLEEYALLGTLVTYWIEPENAFELRSSLIPAVKAVQPWLLTQGGDCPPFSSLLNHCIAELKVATEKALEEPKDWVQIVDLGCNCADCKDLDAFLKNPQEQVHRFRVRKDRRQHLHRKIDQRGCDMTHVTDRKGSPQTLVCTKTRATFQRKTQEYEQDRVSLTELEAFA